MRKDKSFEESVVEWTPINLSDQCTEHGIQSNLEIWAKGFECNILQRANVPKKNWKKSMGRAAPPVFKEDHLFRKSPDPFGAAITQWARVWAKILSTIKELKCLKGKLSKGKGSRTTWTTVKGSTQHFRA